MPTLSFIWVLVPIGLVIGLVLVARILIAKGVLRAPATASVPKGEDLPYKARRYIFSKAEYSFYKVLLLACPEDMVVAPKMRIADLVEIDSGRLHGPAAGWVNRITSKHCDFAICDRQAFTLLGVIELDDTSHQAQKATVRDAFVNQVYSTCGIPVHRQICQRDYSVADLRSVLEAFRTRS